MFVMSKGKPKSGSLIKDRENIIKSGRVKVNEKKRTMGMAQREKWRLLNNRKFIGIEKDEKYYDISCKRIKDAINEKNKIYLKELGTKLLKI
jgi:hypothetical protein